MRPVGMTLRQTLPISVVFAVALHLAGCDRPDRARKQTVPESEGIAPVVPGSAPLAHATSVAATPAPEAPQSAAVAPIQPEPEVVLLRWASAIEARDWAKVRRMWGNDGADSGLSPRTFAERWDGLRRPRVAVGPGQQEGAAGSLYYTAPVTISDGPRRIAGQVTLRRVNDVPGATPAQLRWHFDPTVRKPWTTLR